MEKIPYTQTLKARSTSAVLFRIRDIVVPSGWWLFIQHFGCEDEDNGCDKIRVGRGRDAGIVHPFEDQVPAVAGTFYHTEKPLYFVPEGEKLIAEFYGSTLNDHCKLIIDGYLTKKRQSGSRANEKKVAE